MSWLVLTGDTTAGMMRASLQTTVAGRENPEKSRPMRPRTDAAFPLVHGVAHSMAGRAGQSQGWPVPRPGILTPARFRHPP